MGGTHPMDGALDLAAVGGIAVARLKVGGAVDGGNAAVGILLHACLLYTSIVEKIMNGELFQKKAKEGADHE